MDTKTYMAIASYGYDATGEEVKTKTEYILGEFEVKNYLLNTFFSMRPYPEIVRVFCGQKPLFVLKPKSKK